MSTRNRCFFYISLVVFFVGVCQSVNAQEIEPKKILTELQKRYTVNDLETNLSGIPTFIEGDLTPLQAVGDEINISYLFFEENLDVFKMNNPRQELILEKVQKDDIGMTHLFFKQVYQGIEVNGGDLVLHFTSNGRIKSFNGFYKNGINISATPAISQKASEDIATLDLENNQGTITLGETLLMIYEHKKEDHLIWKVTLKQDRPPGNWDYFIDAISGEILYKVNQIIS